MPGPYAPTSFSADITPEFTGFPGLKLRENQFREWYSWAVVASVASAAGLVCHIPAIDENKTDVRVETIGVWNGRLRSIRLQLKASSSLGTARSGGIDYVTHSLKREYYDRFSEPSNVPLFLILVALPPLDRPWTRIRPSIHGLSAAAWWGEVSEPSNGSAYQTVRVPASQRLEVSGFQTMLGAA